MWEFGLDFIAAVSVDWVHHQRRSQRQEYGLLVLGGWYFAFQGTHQITREGIGLNPCAVNHLKMKVYEG